VKAALAVGCLAWASGVQAQFMILKPNVPEAEWLAGVHSALNHRDCQLAVSRLNDGLAARFADAYLMAGTMFEDGLCVKAHWERAASLYRQAHAAGRPTGIYRLVAGLAHRDAAVALWWAQKTGAPYLPDVCRVEAQVHGSAEAYAAALRDWPPGQLGGCSYVAGVQAAVFGELKHPTVALGRYVDGKVTMRFLPSTGRIEWQVVELEGVLPTPFETPAATMARRDAAARQDLERYLETISQRALARYAKPPSLAMDGEITAEMLFSTR
jgi:hypothetical protein